MKQGRHFLNIVLILFPLINLQLKANSFPSYETTRLKSTAGTGVASILVDEASVLNPASLAFYNLSSVYLQRITSDIHRDGQENDEKGPKSRAVILSDTKGTMKGAFSYRDIRHEDQKRKEMTVSGAQNIGERSSFGLLFKRAENKDNSGTKQESYITNIGATHAVSDSLTLGVIFNDLFKAEQGETKFLIGAQYLISDFFTLMADFGGNYREELPQTLIYRGALQIKLFGGIYFRTGTFYDLSIRKKGYGLGAGWISPRRVFEAAMKSSTPYKPLTAHQNKNSLKEVSFSMSYRF